MRFAHFFIDRPRFATVISLVTLLLGIIAYQRLPVAQYPDILPPTVTVTAHYPGASPEVIADVVAAPIEEELNGVEGMLYMDSSATSDGTLQMTVTFEFGVDLDTAQVLVENRMSVAEPRLPEEVRRYGIVVRKSSPDLLMVVHLDSPDGRYDTLYMSNYALLNIKDVLSRIDGIGIIRMMGLREYGLRVWLDPERMTALGISVDDIVAALRSENVQVVGGALGQAPVPADTAFHVMVTSQGRLETVEQFRAVILKNGTDGRLTRLGDVARVEIGADTYNTKGLSSGRPAVAMAIFQRPGTNAIETALEVERTMADLARAFPPGLHHRTVYNPTRYIQASIDAVYLSLVEASLLVVVVILLFLQNWRAAVIPVLAIPVSLIGTFAVMEVFNVSINNLSLFGLVLAIGIVVDDAIVVVENIERNLARGMASRAACALTMDEVGSALVSIGLVLTAVFVPTAFLGGIVGEMFWQFGLTIATATAISVLNSLTLSPALGAVLLRPHDAAPDFFDRLWERSFGWLFAAFNRGFDWTAAHYQRIVAWLIEWRRLALGGFVGLLALTGLGLWHIPMGFMPELDQGYLPVLVELPKGASLERTSAVVEQVMEIAQTIPGISVDSVGFVGFSVATGSAGTQSASVFLGLDEFSSRGSRRTSAVIAGELSAALRKIQDAMIVVATPPPIRGIGSGGDLKMLITDRAGKGSRALEEATWTLAGAAIQAGIVARAYTFHNTSAPRYALDIDRTRARMLDVPVENVFRTLQVHLGSVYVNDFTMFAHNYRVTAQADAPFRLSPADISRLRAANTRGEMVPLGTIVAVRESAGPDRVVRHNLYPAAELHFNVPHGRSSGEALAAMEQLARQVLPVGFDFEWAELAYHQQRAGGLGLLAFPLGILFVFLVLTAQYESWSLPFAIVLIVPLVLLFALAGLMLRGMDLNILAQVGCIVLVGLASKNAILIVEFARQREEAGEGPVEAVIEAARLRLRPVLMTSLAFIAGVIPLALATGPGAEMRRVLGTVVFSGMLGVTVVGLLLTPVFYVVVRNLVGGKGRVSTEPQSETPA